MKRIAIVGFGFMGRTHYGVWRKLRGAKVVAVCDSSLARIRESVSGNIDTGAGSADLQGMTLFGDLDKINFKTVA